MTGWEDDPARRLRAAADPLAPPEVLRRLAAQHPETRPTIAANPACYPALREWLTAARPPRQNLSAGAKTGIGFAIGGGALLLAALVTVALVVPRALVGPHLNDAQAKAAMLAPVDVMDATGSAGGIFPAGIDTYTVSSYARAWGHGSGDGIDPAVCGTAVTGWMSAPSLDGEAYPGRVSDRIFSRENDDDGDIEELRVFIDGHAAQKFLSLEREWYAHCARVTYDLGDDEQRQADYSSVAAPKTDGVAARAYVSWVHPVDDSDEGSYHVDAWLLRGNVVEVLSFGTDSTSATSLDADARTVVAAAAKSLARAG